MKDINIEASLGRQILEEFTEYEMDLKYLIHLFESNPSGNASMELIESAIKGQKELAREVVKYHRKLTKSHLKLKKEIEEMLREEAG